MPSVTYIDIGLNSIDEYWNELVVPSVREFNANPSARSAFQASHSLWHLHDWVWHDRNPDQDSSGAEFTAYRDDLIAACPELAWLRDIADAGKHRGLGRSSLEIKGAAPGLMPGHSMMMTGVGGGIRPIFTLTLNDESKQDVGATLKKAVEYWLTELAARNLASP
jgi:hypothetical protein